MVVQLVESVPAFLWRVYVVTGDPPLSAGAYQATVMEELVDDTRDGGAIAIGTAATMATATCEKGPSPIVFDAVTTKRHVTPVVKPDAE